jgi:hypothetical protein
MTSWLVLKSAHQWLVLKRRVRAPQGRLKPVNRSLTPNHPAWTFVDAHTP